MPWHLNSLELLSNLGLLNSKDGPTMSPTLSILFWRHFNKRHGRKRTDIRYLLSSSIYQVTDTGDKYQQMHQTDGCLQSLLNGPIWSSVTLIKRRKVDVTSKEMANQAQGGGARARNNGRSESSSHPYLVQHYQRLYISVDMSTYFKLPNRRWGGKLSSLYPTRPREWYPIAIFSFHHATAL